MLEEQIKLSNEDNSTGSCVFLLTKQRDPNEDNSKCSIRITQRSAKIIHCLIIVSKVLMIVPGLLSLSSTKFDYWLLSFLSGSLNFLATSLLSYTSFLQSKKKKITKTLNHKLDVLKIKQKLLISEGDDSDKSV